ncbi:uncharacterized protein METZ01_LOCUS181849, partial [marine metagenome]
QNEGMKKVLMFVLALIAAGSADVEQQGPYSETLSEGSEQGNAVAMSARRSPTR